MSNQSQGSEIAQQLSILVNGGSRKDREDFIKSLVHDHPTLQQSTFRLMMEALRMWAKKYDEGHYDLRNEQTCKMAKMMLEAVKDEGIPFI